MKLFASELVVVVNIYSYSYSKFRNKHCKQTRKIKKNTREIREAQFIIYYLKFKSLHLPSNASHAFFVLRYYSYFQVFTVLHNMFTMLVMEQQSTRINSFNFINNCCSFSYNYDKRIENYTN